MAQREAFKQMLRKSGYRATPSRIAILEAFKRSRRPMSTQEIMKEINGSADQATVYRTIRSLKMKGIIKQIDLRHNHAHYELADLAEHHHLICIRCGRVEDVHRCGVEVMESSVLRSSKHFVEIRQHALEFYGVCRSCVGKSMEDVRRGSDV